MAQPHPAPRDLPQPGASRHEILAWLTERRAKAPGHAPVHTLAELHAAQARRLRASLDLPAENSRCEHGYRITDSCPNCP